MSVYYNVILMPQLPHNLSFASNNFKAKFHIICIESYIAKFSVEDA